MWTTWRPHRLDQVVDGVGAAVGRVDDAGDVGVGDQARVEVGEVVAVDSGQWLSPLPTTRTMPFIASRSMSATMPLSPP